MYTPVAHLSGLTVMKLSMSWRVAVCPMFGRGPGLCFSSLLVSSVVLLFHVCFVAINILGEGGR